MNSSAREGRAQSRRVGALICGRSVAKAAVRLTAARHPDAAPFVLDLDLGQAGLVEQVRELADQVLVETAPLLRHGRPLPFSHHVDLPAAMAAASASIASS